MENVKVVLKSKDDKVLFEDDTADNIASVFENAASKKVDLTGLDLSAIEYANVSCNPSDMPKNYNWRWDEEFCVHGINAPNSSFSDEEIYGSDDVTEFTDCNLENTEIWLYEPKQLYFENCNLCGTEIYSEEYDLAEAEYKNCTFDLKTKLYHAGESMDINASATEDEDCYGYYNIKDCKLKLQDKLYDIDKLVVCFTGVRDSNLAENMEKIGIKVVSSVTKACNVVVAKDVDTTSSKAKKVTEQGGVIVSYDDIKGFFSFLGGGDDEDEYGEEDW